MNFMKSWRGCGTENEEVQSTLFIWSRSLSEGNKSPGTDYFFWEECCPLTKGSRRIMLPIPASEVFVQTCLYMHASRFCKLRFKHDDCITYPLLSTRHWQSPLKGCMIYMATVSHQTNHFQLQMWWNCHTGSECIICEPSRAVSYHPELNWTFTLGVIKQDDNEIYINHQKGYCGLPYSSESSPSTFRSPSSSDILLLLLVWKPEPVSYTHLTLPTTAEV